MHFSLPIINKGPKAKTFFHLSDKIIKIAVTDLPVLIIGESGTGKEHMARSIINASGRRNSNTIVVDLSSIPPNMLNSELFGTVGDNSFYKGKLAPADRGTILIKGIETMPLETQAKLLDFMQHGSFCPEGAKTSRLADVRIITTAKRTFAEDVKTGRFSENLYKHISQNTIYLSPLRTRRDDLKLIIERVTRHFAEKYHKKNIRMESEAMSKLINYDWPGNLREIESKLEKLVFLSEGNNINKENLLNFINIF